MGVGNGIKAIAADVTTCPSPVEGIRSLVQLAGWGDLQEDLGRSHAAVRWDGDINEEGGMGK
jgi:hypothetical protein